MEKYVIKKDGFTDFYIRKAYYGVRNEYEWQYLAHTYNNGDERWEKLPQSEDAILNYLHKYGEKVS